MGFGGIGYDPAAQREMLAADLERERSNIKQDQEEARNARLEEEKLRLSLERAARAEQFEAMEAEKLAIEESEEEAIEEQMGQQQAQQNVMSFFSERPGIQIAKPGNEVRPE